MAIEITSDDIIPTDTSFRLKAGPGAGKTHWLINHVWNIIKNADLGKFGKVVCLTYSNIGVDTISTRLGKTNFVEVSTIHSFLYTNLIKPYLYLIADKYGFSMTNFSGLVDDYILDDYLTLEKVQNELKRKSPKTYINPTCWSTFLKDLKWVLKDNNEGKLSCLSRSPINKYNGTSYPAPNGTGIIYKKIAWNHGIMHYDDVNFFAYKLIIEYPWLAKVLSIAYPFIFIDEFQDTNPIQAFIFQQICSRSGFMGVIGDVAQSIYGFQGASPKCFNDFVIPNVKEFVIRQNRRSTPQIINFLNCLRHDIKQESIINEEGPIVKFLVGEKKKAFTYAQELVKEDILVLSYSNIETNSLRYQILEGRGDEKAIKIDDIVDSNSDRKLLVTAFIKAIEHAKQAKFKYAFNALERAGIKSDECVDRLRKLMQLQNIDHLTMTEFVESIRKQGFTISSLRAGKAKNFYDSHTYGQIAQSISIEEDNGNQRTIHKAKGDESDNVLVLVGERFPAADFLKFDISKKESYRVYYVAMSRARKQLFINIPSVSSIEEIQLKNTLPIEIVQL